MKRLAKNRDAFIWVMALLLVAELAVLCFYGTRKAGFHEDELYTYYSSNKTAGLFVNDRQWMSRRQLWEDFVVLPGEQFRYSVVKQMQSWDVHPPLYYYIFHTACSFFPETFSKWLGIGVNLIAYILSYLLLAWSCYMAAEMRAEPVKVSGEVLLQASGKSMNRQGWYLAFLTCLAWGFSGAVISGALFIRMYQWLTLFILLCLSLHLRAMEKEDYSVRTFLLPVALTAFCGFLTQYYYLIFHFFLGAGFVFRLLRQKKFREAVGYGAACALGTGAAVLYYPACLSHIFSGYRGTEAVSEFADAANTGGRLRFFIGLFDDYVMCDSLIWWLLLLCLLGVTLYFLKKRGRLQGKIGNPGVTLILFAAAGYFFTVSKTALLLGETSNRYELPVYGLLLFLFLWSVWTFGGRLLVCLHGAEGKNAFGAGRVRGRFASAGTGRKLLAAALLVCVLIMDGRGLIEGRVFFLYPQEAEIMEYIKANSGTPVAVFYNEASPNNIWRLSDELMKFPKVYLASQGNESPIQDKILVNSNRLLAYVADHEDKEACLKRLVEENENLSSYRIVAQKELWTLYECR